MILAGICEDLASRQIQETLEAEECDVAVMSCVGGDMKFAPSQERYVLYYQSVRKSSIT